jgi:predicted alpha/beta hydrolase family esterase
MTPTCAKQAWERMLAFLAKYAGLMATPELTPADWVNISLTEAMLARDGPPLYVAAKLGCVAAVRVMCEAGTHLEVLARTRRPAAARRRRRRP